MDKKRHNAQSLSDRCDYVIIKRQLDHYSKDSFIRTRCTLEIGHEGKHLGSNDVEWIDTRSKIQR